MELRSLYLRLVILASFANEIDTSGYAEMIPQVRSREGEWEVRGAGTSRKAVIDSGLGSN